MKKLRGIADKVLFAVKNIANYISVSGLRLIIEPIGNGNGSPVFIELTFCR